MKNIYSATSQAVRLNSSRGFTLIELLIVIAIIAILASLAIPQYLKYQRKARVSSYAEPIARGCMLDMVAWCTENASGAPPTTQLANCSANQIQTAGGQVTLSVTPGTCNNDGTLSDSTATATLDTATDYTAVCTYVDQSVKCTIQG